MFPVLSSAYLAPVQWYAKLFQSNGCWMEQHDHFIKQTYRNRCIIATANGAQALTIPTFQDFRDTTVPKNPPHDPDFTPRPYYQVFAQRHGFLPNLSVIDLLFNMGNEAPLYL